MPVPKTKMQSMEHQMYTNGKFVHDKVNNFVCHLNTPVNICFLSSNKGKLNSYLLPCIPQMCIVNHKIWTFVLDSYPFGQRIQAAGA